jgi:hypothetical protein
MNLPTSEQNAYEASKPRMMQKWQKLIYNALQMPKSSSDSNLDSKTSITSASMPKHSTDRMKCVQFSYVEIREHGRILVDHPECKDGIALGLDWKHSPRTTRISLALFETIRNSQGRRTIKYMQRLSLLEKKNLLVDIGGYHEEMVLNEHLKYCHSLDNESRKLKAPAA